MARGPSSINVVSLTIYLLLLTGCYGSYKYLPIVWKKSQLEEIIKTISYDANRAESEQLKRVLIEQSKTQEGIELSSDDISIERLPDRVRLRVVWRPVVRFIGGKMYQHQFVIQRETMFYN